MRNITGKEKEYLEKRRALFFKKVEEANKLRDKRTKEVNQRRDRKKEERLKREKKEYHEKIGDRYSQFCMLITKNRKKSEYISQNKWMVSAYQNFNDKLKEREEVLFPKIFEVEKKGVIKPVKYELILVEYSDKDFTNSVSKIRNDFGKFVDVEVVDKDGVKIVEKEDWYIEEDFYVFGYDKKKDRKTASFILNELILKNDYKQFTTKRIYRYENKLIIKSDFDLSVVVCKNVEEAVALSGVLYKNIPEEEKFTFFYNNPLMCKSNILKEVRELTGWTWQYINRNDEPNIKS